MARTCHAHQQKKQGKACLCLSQSQPIYMAWPYRVQQQHGKWQGVGEIAMHKGMVRRGPKAWGNACLLAPSPGMVMSLIVIVMSPGERKGSQISSPILHPSLIISTYHVLLFFTFLCLEVDICLGRCAKRVRGEEFPFLLYRGRKEEHGAESTRS